MSTQLDRLLGENLFGWVYRPDGTIPQIIGDAWQDPEGNIVWELPAYSSTWEGMGAVVEAMHKRGWWCRITSPFSAQVGDLWWGGFTPHQTTGWNGRPDYKGSGASAPEAVARAALAVLGVEVPS